MLRDDYTIWHCGDHELSLARPRVMGIVNVTPDSFSDGGDSVSIDKAVARAIAMLDEGADIIDIGGESTAPGAAPVTADVEAGRIVPVIRAVHAAVPDAIISIDTRHAAVARLALRMGASIINDVTGFIDEDMVNLAVDSGCGCIINHWHQDSATSTRKEVRLDSAMPARLNSPTRRFTVPEESMVMRDVMGFLGDQARTLMRSGVSRGSICIDPGLGFDKDASENVVIQRAGSKLASMGYPVLIGPSRKRYVGAISGVGTPKKRDSATIGTVLAAIEQGARIVRVHNVAMAAQAINTYWACTRKDPRLGFVSIGSNVGDRMANLSRAVRAINELPLTCVTDVSHAYETEPAYGIATAVINAVVEIRTELHPLVLMDALLEVEHKLGRRRSTRGTTGGPSPRTIDCDLCWVQGESHAGAKLTLPHPRMGEREYVLVPMEDLMRDPVRFLSHGGVPIADEADRVGYVIDDLGEIEWENTNT